MALKAHATPQEHPPVWPPPKSPSAHKALDAGAPTRHRRLRRVLKIALWMLLVLVVLLAGVGAYGYWRISRTVTSFAGPHFNTGHNAVWLEHAWAGDPHSASEYDALADQLEREQVAYVFAHVGPLNSDGSIPTSLAPYAQTFADAMHARLPNLKVLAWIGQVEAASGLPSNEVVNLNDSSVRAAIAATAARFVRDDDFDGVHYDIEPIRNNNPRFIDLLDATRAVLPHGAILSVSAQKWAPSAHIADLFYNAGRAGEWWTTYFYEVVAAHVDQIAVMAYDTAMPTAGAYQLFVKEETQHILAIARSVQHPPQVLIGLPTYTGDSVWFHASAENMTSGLNGVVSGLNSDTTTQPFTGVAIYRLGVTSEASWASYNHLWLGQS